MRGNYTNYLRLLWHTFLALQEAKKQCPKEGYLTIDCSHELEEMLLDEIKEALNNVEAVNHAS
jgi:hypothetical protein